MSSSLCVMFSLLPVLVGVGLGAGATAALHRLLAPREPVYIILAGAVIASSVPPGIAVLAGATARCPPGDASCGDGHGFLGFYAMLLGCLAFLASVPVNSVLAPEVDDPVPPS